MAGVQRAYRNSTILFGVLITVLGVALVVTTLARGDGALSYRAVIGVLFAALGAGRLYLAAAPHGER